MHFFFKTLFALLTLTVGPSQFLIGETIVYRTPKGDFAIMEVQSESSFAEVISLLRSEINYEEFFSHPGPQGDENTYFVDFMVCSNDFDSGKAMPKSTIRQYNATLTASEKKKIGEIIETLGNSSLVSIAASKSSIEKKSKEVETVHPLQFLGYIFSDEKIKAAMHNLHGKGWVWSKFSRGLKDGLETEYNNQNLLQYIPDFCNRLNIDSKILYPLAEKQRWKDFVEALFIEIPRPETSTRYDM